MECIMKEILEEISELTMEVIMEEKLEYISQQIDIDSEK